MKAIISGGGSGGHIFPAIAIANAIRSRWPEAEILFIGAEGRMEMDKVPAAGYKIEGLPIAGLQRKLTLKNIVKNLQLPFRIARSNNKVRRILRQFGPDIVVGVGGFASEPTLRTAAKMGFATLIQEQNSYAGLTNKTLAKGARTICVAYDGMERFFPAEKIVFTGNPVRADIEHMACTRNEGLAHFGLDANLPTVLVVGGSLGARSINQMMLANIATIGNKAQYIWQTGQWGYDEATKVVADNKCDERVKVNKFIQRMDLAYAAADVVVSRAGAIAISELCLVGKPVVLIPSPNVAEDHQTKNAMALSAKGAAIVVRDDQCAILGPTAVNQLLADSGKRSEMSHAISSMAVRGAAEKIVDEIEKIIKH
ncbi:MAG: undecaprenyldiphospho-muramoylpentapeptide beta-N-acetylglucosaminyltransferase [Bacteroidales bacterium]|nr:undecaprenyldiphospho-muramoylpentapeptide beta-N-acetylglucosaminyltransferase [Bacteroidales bacterium]